MINFPVVFAMILRYVYNLKHDLNSVTDAFYMPAMQIFIWGLTSNYLKNSNQAGPQIVMFLLSGVVFWIVIDQGQQAISVNLLREFWDRNLVNIFSSPLRLREWILAIMIEGTIRMSFSLLFGILLVLALYNTDLFIYGMYIIPFVISLLITGWAIGFFISGLIVRYGHQFQAFAWIGITALAPFSAVYYPISSLPQWMQYISAILPPSYVFTGMRQILQTGTLSYEQLLMSFLMNIIYLVLAIYFFVIMFNKSKKLGLGRLI